MKTTINSQLTTKCSIRKTLILMLLHVVFLSTNSFAQSNDIVQFVYTSDLHYGISRQFRGEEHVESSAVNQAMIRQMNALPTPIRFLNNYSKALFQKKKFTLINMKPSWIIFINSATGI